jgi:Mn2+/Fe2+ NRAMP family transporter
MLQRLRNIGPGIVIAATGLGAGDLIAASVAGAKYGTALLWAAVIGAIMKFAMNEGLARWQLATGTTLLEGWVHRLPRFISIYFFIYLLLWTFMVAGALIGATGLAAHALYPGLSVGQWGVIHSLLALLLVLTGRYALLELVMKLFIGLMLVVVMVCAILVLPDSGDILTGILQPSVPKGSILYIFGIIGGVGGSVTLVCYGYWIRERGWTHPADMAQSRVDLAVAYIITGLFGIAIMIIAAGVNPEVITGKKMALSVANHLETIVGPVGMWCFLIGFWSAVFSSMLGVWQGVPYIFSDFVEQYTRRPNAPSRVNTRSFAYRGYLLYIALPPMLLLHLVEGPVWMVILYAVAGAFFMPLLAGLLLYMNNRRGWVQGLRNGALANLVLLVSVLLFGLLMAEKLTEVWQSAAWQ